MRRPAWSDAIALAVAVAGLAAVAVFTGSPPDTYVDTASTYDSEGGGYLGWYRLAERSGVRVERFLSQADALDGRIATLVAANNGAFFVLDVAPLERFVRAGGNLVWVSNGVDETDRAWRPLHFPHFTRTRAPGDFARTIVPSAAVRGVRSLAGEGRTRIEPRDFPPAVPLAADRYGAVVVRYALGAGHVTVVTDPALFMNRNLARADNAQLALAAVLGGRSGTVAFDEAIRGYGASRSVWSVLPVPLRAATLGAAGVAIVALLGAGLRSLPPAPPAPEREPSTNAYVWSLAALLRRGRGAARAANDLAESTFAQAGRTLAIAGIPDERRLVAAYRARGDERAAALVREIARMRMMSPLGDDDLVAIAERCFELRTEEWNGSERRRRQATR